MSTTEQQMVVAHFIVSDDVERSRRFYTEVLGGRTVISGEAGDEVTYVALANSWVIINVGGGPTDDKPTVTLETQPDPDRGQHIVLELVADVDDLIGAHPGGLDDADEEGRVGLADAPFGRGGDQIDRQVEGAQLVFGPLATTRKMCVPALMDQERKFLAALAATRTFRFEGPYLRFYGAAGAELVRFTRLDR